MYIHSRRRPCRPMAMWRSLYTKGLSQYHCGVNWPCHPLEAARVDRREMGLPGVCHNGSGGGRRVLRLRIEPTQERQVSFTSYPSLADHERHSSSGISQSVTGTNRSDSVVFSNTLPIGESRNGM